MNVLGSYDARFMQVQVLGKLKVLRIGPGLELQNALSQLHTAILSDRLLRLTCPDCLLRVNLSLGYI